MSTGTMVTIQYPNHGLPLLIKETPWQVMMQGGCVIKGSIQSFHDFPNYEATAIEGVQVAKIWFDRFDLTCARRFG